MHVDALHNPASDRPRPLGPRRAQPAIDASTGRGGLPSPLTSLIGREAEVAAVLALLAQRTRLVTLTGPGGVGKTRLALRIGEAAAAQYADGVVFGSLAMVATPGLVLPSIARALGLQDWGEQPAGEVVARTLRDSRLLLVIDNFEQVRSAAADLAAILGRCPGVDAIVTSRVLLRVTGERRFPVAPLALPVAPGAGGTGPGRGAATAIAAAPAVQLFIARAQAADPDFALDDRNASAIADICRRLDGLPLAIELAAARAHLLEPAELLARLRPALPFLSGGPADAPDRLRTMSNAIAWSYDLLTADEQRLLRRVAVFAGGFSLDAAESVAGAESSMSCESDSDKPSPIGELKSFIFSLAASLVEKSLLQRMSTNGESRFVMLETIREFALERLVASGEMEAVNTRYVAWCVALAEEVRRSGRLSHREGLGQLEVEHANLRAALTWLHAQGEVTLALHLASELAEFWLRHGHWVEGGGWLRRLLDADSGLATVARSSALVGLSMMTWARREFIQARALLDEAEATAREVGDAGALAYARLHQGYVAVFMGDFDLAVARGEECLETCHAIPQGFSCNGALWLLAHAALVRGEDERATMLYEQLYTVSQAGGDDISIANSIRAQAILAGRRGDLAQALSGLAGAAATCLRYGDVMYMGHCLDCAGMAAIENGWPEPAARWLSWVAALYAAVDTPPGPSLHADPDRHGRAVNAARSALGEHRFAQAWSAGAALTAEETIDEVTALAGVVAGSSAGGQPARSELSPREREILRLVAQGWSDKEIAAELRIGRRTVSTHVAAIRAKLKATSRSAAAAIATRNGLT